MNDNMDSSASAGGISSWRNASGADEEDKPKPTSSWLGLTRVNKVNEKYRTNQSRDLALRFLEEQSDDEADDISKKRTYDEMENDDNIEEEEDISKRTDETTAAVINIWAKKQKINEEKDVRLGNVWVMSNCKVSVEKASLSENIVECLKNNRHNPVRELFAVQRAVVPVLIAMTKSGVPGDICIGSPTGSGKTLSYVLPIVEVLSSLKFTKLRAIVIVPNSQLVKQVTQVFRSFEKYTSLKVKSLNPYNRFESEQSDLVDSLTGDSKVDILIGTPSLFVEHIKKTKNFTLEHLKFLVYDEVDTLLSDEHSSFIKVIADTYYNW